MGTVKLFPETTKFPITLIGHRAGVCWGADTSDDEKNYKRGMECLRANHGRTVEFPDIEAVFDGFSARVIREWYTHVGGAPTRLQASTRYINYANFDYVTPHSIAKNEEAKEVYDDIMTSIRAGSEKLKKLDIPREDCGMILPLAMTTRIVDKRNLRNIIDMSHQRMCTRAYWEYRELFKAYADALRTYSKEWEYIVDTYFVPKCEVLGYCPETKSCGRKSKKVEA